MIRKIMTGTMLAAALTAFGAAAVLAEGTKKVDIQGISFEIPEAISDLVTIQEDGLEADEIVAVYETASAEAAKELGEDIPGAGWIFTISTVPEEKMKELRCGGMDGMDVFAEDDDIYYVYNHATDVRYVRKDNEEMEKDLEQWTTINEWAGQEVRQEILANNPELDDAFYTNTYLDMLLAQAAYKPGTKFELRSLEYGPDPLDPATLDEDDYIEDLAEDYTYEEIFDTEAPDGEYYVLAFDVNGEEIRYDFFVAEDSRDLIRETRMVGDEEYETLYMANPKEADDAYRTTTDIMEEWCDAIANGGEADDDGDDD